MRMNGESERRVTAASRRRHLKAVTFAAAVFVGAVPGGGPVLRCMTAIAPDGDSSGGFDPARVHYRKANKEFAHHGRFGYVGFLCYSPGNFSRNDVFSDNGSHPEESSYNKNVSVNG